MPVKTLKEEELKRVIKRYLPTRLAVDLVDQFVTHNHDMLEIKKLAVLLHIKPATVKQTVADLSARGVLKTIGGGVVNYAPDTEVGEQLQAFYNAWHNAATRRSLLPLLPSTAQAQGGGLFDRIMGFFRK